MTYVERDVRSMHAAVVLSAPTSAELIADILPQKGASDAEVHGHCPNVSFICLVA